MLLRVGKLYVTSHMIMESTVTFHLLILCRKHVVQTHKRCRNLCFCVWRHAERNTNAICSPRDVNQSRTWTAGATLKCFLV
ncbi:unnamed protein product [Cylicocyclus nassatus]|uniref:Uncharacterized protein n=1 Tax=Cylicocyclus nassatus TaxID=53992 RepID=A0AA36DIK4_CYLNA|nr:unnamed protein product [Cylicocyclus nassatus]